MQFVECLCHVAFDLVNGDQEKRAQFVQSQPLIYSVVPLPLLIGFRDIHQNACQNFDLKFLSTAFINEITTHFLNLTLFFLFF